MLMRLIVILLVVLGHIPVPELEGDVNGDCIVDIADAALVGAAFGTSNPLYDLNGDGIVDEADLQIVSDHYWETCQQVTAGGRRR